jgi:hypothetical protein
LVRRLEDRRRPLVALLVCLALALAVTLALSVSGVAAAQETTDEPTVNGTTDEPTTTDSGPVTVGGAEGTDGDDNGTTESGDGDGGLVGTVLGAVGTVATFFLESRIGHAIVGIPLGVFLGLKLVAYYLESQES